MTNTTITPANVYFDSNRMMHSGRKYQYLFGEQPALMAAVAWTGARKLRPGRMSKRALNGFSVIAKFGPNGFLVYWNLKV
jgi:hypothetical protein